MTSRSSNTERAAARLLVFILRSGWIAVALKFALFGTWPGLIFAGVLLALLTPAVEFRDE